MKTSLKRISFTNAGRRFRQALQAATRVIVVGLMTSVLHPVLAADLEKEDLKFGFIKLTDMAPLAIAYEKG